VVAEKDNRMLQRMGGRGVEHPTTRLTGASRAACCCVCSVQQYGSRANKDSTGDGRVAAMTTVTALAIAKALGISADASMVLRSSLLALLARLTASIPKSTALTDAGFAVEAGAVTTARACIMQVLIMCGNRLSPGHYST
jgi:hypothetical protein